MMRSVLLLPALLVPMTAFAQASPADVAYCNRLADLYDRYLGQSDNSSRRDNPANSPEGQVPRYSAARASQAPFRR